MVGWSWRAQSVPSVDIDINTTGLENNFSDGRYAFLRRVCCVVQPRGGHSVDSLCLCILIVILVSRYHPHCPLP